LIIKSSRLPAAVGAKTTAQHVLRGPDNKQIELLRGSEDDLHDWVRDARRRRKEFAIRHWKLSPERDISEAQEGEMVAALAAEFGFDPERVVLIRHTKERHKGEASDKHFHLLVPEVDPVSGRTLSTRWDYARHEKVARALELSWGHRLVPGRFSQPVARALEAEGRALEGALVALGPGAEPRPESAYPPGLDQEVRRKAKRSMARVRDAVLDARALSGGDPQDFQRLLGEDGLRVVRGDKASRWVVQARAQDGGWTFAGALHRLARMTAQEADAWMRGIAPAPDRGRETRNDDRHEARDGRALDAAHDGGAAGGPARARGPAAARRAGDDPGLRGQPGGGRPGLAADGAARRGGKGGRGPAGRAEGPAGAAAGGAAADSGAAGRAHRHPVPAHGAAGGRAGPGGGGGAAARGEAQAQGQEAAPRRAAPGGRDRRVAHLVAAARIRARLDPGEVRAWREGIPRPPFGQAFGERRVVQLACDEEERVERQRRFRLLMLRRAYPLCAWLPPEAVLHMARVDWEPVSGRLLLVLTSGTRLLDSGDRILLKGRADDLSVSEMAACVERRGWGSVVVEGDPEFRAEMARELLSRGIEVEDCPLPRAEAEALRAEAAWAGRAADTEPHVRPGTGPRP